MAQRQWALDWRSVIFHLLDVSLILAGGRWQAFSPATLEDGVGAEV